MSLRGPYDIGEPQSLITTVIPFLKTTVNLWFPLLRKKKVLMCDLHSTWLVVPAKGNSISLWSLAKTKICKKSSKK